MMERVRVAAQSQVTTTFSSGFIDALPILGRDYQDVLTLAPTIHGSRDTNVVTLGDGVSTAVPPPPPPPAKRSARPKIDAAKPIAGVIIRIAARRPEFRAADVIEISVTIENRSGKAVQVPAVLSVADGTARFRVLDPQGVAAADRIQQRGPARMTTLQPGASAAFNVILNGTRGYRFVRPGEYRVTLLGVSLGLGDSNTLSLRIRP
jgi:hypothetical protein